MMTIPSSPQLHSSSWFLLVLGFLLGQSSTGGMTMVETVLASWQSWVNIFVVPIYGFCVLLYIGLRFCRQVDLKGFFQKEPTPPSLIEEEEPLEEEGIDEEGPVNMTGAYKLVKNDNFEGFLAVQGVPWALRRAADKARPIHRITHRGRKVRIKIQGIIESETTYQINGPPVEINIRGRSFRDRMTYLETGDGIRVRKEATEENYNIEVTRRLSEDRQTITMTSQAIFKDGQEPVESVQLFERIE